jgi:hypothetical protein
MWLRLARRRGTQPIARGWKAALEAARARAETEQAAPPRPGSSARSARDLQRQRALVRAEQTLAEALQDPGLTDRCGSPPNPTSTPAVALPPESDKQRVEAALFTNSNFAPTEAGGAVRAGVLEIRRA